MSRKKILPYVLMHSSFLLYSGYALLGKFASKEAFLSARFISLYAGVFFILALYAILWQQVLKQFPLVTAVANKTITIVWGIIFGKLFFDEQIRPNMIAGSLIILAGIAVLCTEKEQPHTEKDSADE